VKEEPMLDKADELLSMAKYLEGMHLDKQDEKSLPALHSL
jgi:hypothetical protein